MKFKAHEIELRSRLRYVSRYVQVLPHPMPARAETAPTSQGPGIPTAAVAFGRGAEQAHGTFFVRRYGYGDD